MNGDAAGYSPGEFTENFLSSLKMIRRMAADITGYNRFLCAIIGKLNFLN